MRIYTRTGDTGETGVIGGARVGKHDPVIEVVGALDELNAHMGLARHHTEEGPIHALLERLQSAVFDAGSEVAADPESRHYAPARLDPLVAELEGSIDSQEEALPALTNFILPGGCPGACQMHVARTVCRRAERALVGLREEKEVRQELLRFLNRLSDWMFVSARTLNAHAGIRETVWRREG